MKGFTPKTPKNEQSIAVVNGLNSECTKQFFDNVRYLMNVYGLGWDFMCSDGKKLGFSLWKSTAWRMERDIYSKITIKYLLYYVLYFRIRFGCPVSVGEMLSFDLSVIQRYSKENLLKGRSI